MFVVPDDCDKHVFSATCSEFLQSVQSASHATHRLSVGPEGSHRPIALLRVAVVVQGHMCRLVVPTSACVVRQVEVLIGAQVFVAAVRSRCDGRGNSPSNTPLTTNCSLQHPVPQTREGVGPGVCADVERCGPGSAVVVDASDTGGEYILTLANVVATKVRWLP